MGFGPRDTRKGTLNNVRTFKKFNWSQHPVISFVGTCGTLLIR